MHNFLTSCQAIARLGTKILPLFIELFIASCTRYLVSYLLPGIACHRAYCMLSINAVLHAITCCSACGVACCALMGWLHNSPPVLHQMILFVFFFFSFLFFSLCWLFVFVLFLFVFCLFFVFVFAAANQMVDKVVPHTACYFVQWHVATPGAPGGVVKTLV